MVALARTHARPERPTRDVRIGGLLYRAALADVGPTLSVESGDGTASLENARDGTTFVQILVRRSNATQSFVATGGSSIVLVTSDGVRRPAYRVVPERCDHGDECAVLDPGEARADRWVFSVPDNAEHGASRAQWRLWVTAGTNEAGPREGSVAPAESLRSL